MSIIKGTIAGSALLLSTTVLGHGPHAEVSGNDIMANLLHLLAHAWPVVPLAVIGYFAYKRFILR
jgi:hypothetical protein